MDLLSGLQLGFVTALQPSNLMFAFIGVLVGQAIGVIPGIGAMTAIAMLLPLTFYLDPTESMIMLAGIYYGSQYGGAIVSILLSLPGTPTAVVTCFEGYPMARKGGAAKALRLAALASLFGSIVGIVIVAAGALPLSRFALSFGAVEYFALMMLGLIASSVVSSGAPLPAVAMSVLGILLGLVGTDINTGTYRFVLTNDFADGISMMALAMGVFGAAEILNGIGVQGKVEPSAMRLGWRAMLPTKAEMRGFFGPAWRGSLIGSLFGALPGTGGTVSTFISYGVEQRLGRKSGPFGTGRPEGLIAPEAANNAGSITTFIPTMTLGIPGDAIMALMLGALIINGITPGPAVITENPSLFWGLIASFVVGNVMLVVLNLPLVGLWVKFLSIPYWALYPGVMVCIAVGVYTFRNSVMDIYVATAFCLIGVLMRQQNYPAAPLLLGFILGPMLEENLRRAMLLHDGDLTVFLLHPISAVCLGLTALVLLLPLAGVLLSRLRTARGQGGTA
jgi:putative tricarboxylic transport membrane protein